MGIEIRQPGKRRAEFAGRPLNVPDGQIAATALEHGLTLVTRNVKDFDDLGLVIINPWEAACPPSRP